MRFYSICGVRRSQIVLALEELGARGITRPAFNVIGDYVRRAHVRDLARLGDAVDGCPSSTETPSATAWPRTGAPGLAQILQSSILFPYWSRDMVPSSFL
jgi:hypothetical protein